MISLTLFEAFVGVIKTSNDVYVAFVIECGHAASSFEHVRQSLLTVHVFITVDWLLLYQDSTCLERWAVRYGVIEATKNDQILIWKVYGGGEWPEAVVHCSLRGWPKLVLHVVLGYHSWKPANNFYFLTHGWLEISSWHSVEEGALLTGGLPSTPNCDSRPINDSWLA